MVAYAYNRPDVSMILRDADANSANGLEERLYPLHDANFNVTSLVNTLGEVIERFIQDPYGTVTFLNPDFSAKQDNVSDYAWVYLHQGNRLDLATLLYHVRRRELSPTLGRWLQVDPLGYIDGKNTYNYVGSQPTIYLDPYGTGKLGKELRRMYRKRGVAGAFIIPQVFTGLYEWGVHYHWVFQDDGSIENASGSSRARHAFMVAKALADGVSPDGQWHRVNVDSTNIYDFISRKDYNIYINEEPNVRNLDQAAFWLGSTDEFRGAGSYEIRLTRSNNNSLIAEFRTIQMSWGWVDEIDAHSAFEYNWRQNDFLSGVFECAVDIVGDKLLNANYWVLVGFRERGWAGPYEYDLTTQWLK